MLSLTLREMRAHGRRLLGTSLAVLLGVAFLTGTLVLGDTLRRNFDTLFTDAGAGTDVVVRSATDLTLDSPRGLIPLSLVDAIGGVDGVRTAEPVVSGYGQLLGADGEALGGNGPPQTAGSWIGDPDLNPYRLAEGRAPEGGDEVVVNRGTAEDGDLRVGDTTTLLTPEPVTVTIVGIATVGDEDGLGPVTFTGFALDDALRHVAKSTDEVSSISVEAEDGVSQSTLAERVGKVLPDGIEATTGTAAAQESVDDLDEQFLGMLTTTLTAFAGVALLVATFSIYNTFSIIVAQRSRQAALLRALGARRGQVLRGVVAEAVVVGLVASVAGIVAGIGIAGLLKGLFDAAGFALPAGGIVVTTGAVVASVVVGLLVTLAAGIAPAVRASRVAPLAALREVAVERTSPSPARIVAGAVLGAAGIGLTLAGALSSGDALPVVGIGALVLVVATVVAGPLVARPTAAVLGAPVARLRGMTGGLARENAMRNPRRTSATASALMVGIAVVTVFTVFAASLQASTEDTIDRSFASDLVVTTGAFGGGGISPQLTTEVAALPEVEAAVGVGAGFAEVDGSPKELSIADPAALAEVLDVDVTEGDLADVTGGRVAVSDTTADEHGWTVGDVVPFTFADGDTEDLTLAAVYDGGDVSTTLGGYLVPRTVWTPHAVQDIDSVVLVTTGDGTSVAEARRAVEDVAARYGEPDVQDRDEFAETMTTGVDMMLTIIYALLALAIVIALMGIANTLSLSIHERTRELGLLRAVGESRAQVRSMVRWESVIIATFGAVVGVGLGVFLGWALVQGVAAASGGLGVFTVPVARLAVVLAVGGVAGVLAGLRPARRAARLDVLRAIATE